MWFVQIVQWLDGTLRPDILARVVGGGASDHMGGNVMTTGQTVRHCRRTQAFLHVSVPAQAMLSQINQSSVCIMHHCDCFLEC